MPRRVRAHRRPRRHPPLRRTRHTRAGRGAGPRLVHRPPEPGGCDREPIVQHEKPWRGADIGHATQLALRNVLPGPGAFAGHMNEYCAVFGCRGLAAAMRSHIEPSWSDGLFAAGALRVGDHMLLTSLALLSRPLFSAPCVAEQGGEVASRVGLASWSVLQLIPTRAAKGRPIGLVLHCRRARRLGRIAAGRRSHRRVRCGRRPEPPMRES